MELNKFIQLNETFLHLYIIVFAPIKCFLNSFLFEPVAERTSYCCLARKLIWPLGSTHIFIQWGWLILFNPDHFSRQHQIGESPPNSLFLNPLFLNRTDVLTVRSLHSSSITKPWGKPYNLWTSWVYSLSPRVPSWIWIRCIQSATHTWTPLSRLQLWLCRLRRITLPRHPATLSQGNIFWRHARFSSTTTRNTHSWGTTSFLSLTSKHDLCNT